MRAWKSRWATNRCQLNAAECQSGQALQHSGSTVHLAVCILLFSWAVTGTCGPGTGTGHSDTVGADGSAGTPQIIWAHRLWGYKSQGVPLFRLPPAGIVLLCHEPVRNPVRVSVGCAGSQAGTHWVTGAATAAQGLWSLQGHSGVVSLWPQEWHLKGQTGKLP